MYMYVCACVSVLKGFHYRVCVCGGGINRTKAYMNNINNGWGGGGSSGLQIKAHAHQGYLNVLYSFLFSYIRLKSKHIILDIHLICQSRTVS